MSAETWPNKETPPNFSLNTSLQSIEVNEKVPIEEYKRSVEKSKRAFEYVVPDSIMEEEHSLNESLF